MNRLVLNMVVSFMRYLQGFAGSSTITVSVPRLPLNWHGLWEGDEMVIGRAKSFGAFKTSMLQDTEAGKPVELDALLTVAHDIGKIVDVPTPFIDSVLGLARLRARKLGLFDMVA